jgi:hypothetical protein
LPSLLLAASGILTYQKLRNLLQGHTLLLLLFVLLILTAAQGNTTVVPAY